MKRPWTENHQSPEQWVYETIVRHDRTARHWREWVDLSGNDKDEFIMAIRELLQESLEEDEGASYAR